MAKLLIPTLALLQTVQQDRNIDMFIKLSAKINSTDGK